MLIIDVAGNVALGVALEETSICGGPIGNAALFNILLSLSRSSRVVSWSATLDPVLSDFGSRGSCSPPSG